MMEKFSSSMKSSSLRVDGTQKDDTSLSLWPKRTKRLKSTGQDSRKRKQRTIIFKSIGLNGLTKKMKERPRREEQKRTLILKA